jgi:hypothetical protein
MLEQWRLEPPVGQLFAAFIGYEPAPSAEEMAEFERFADEFLDGPKPLQASATMH